MITFFAIYAALFAFCTTTLVGFYLATRGDYEALVDGSKRKRGRVLRAWSHYWDQTKGSKLVPYKGAAFHELAKTAMPLLAQHLPPPGVIIYKPNHIKIEKTELTECRREFLEHELGVKIFTTDLSVPETIGGSGTQVQSIYFCKEYTQYRFPEWVRHPIASCITCFASIYGSAFYWLSVWQIHNLFAWSDVPLFSKLFFWATFCFSLACSTTFIVKMMNKK